MTHPELAAIAINCACAAVNLHGFFTGRRTWRRLREDQQSQFDDVIAQTRQALSRSFAENFVVRQALMKLAALEGAAVVVDRTQTAVTVRVEGLGEFSAAFADVETIADPDGSLSMKAKGKLRTGPDTVVAEPSHDVH